MSEDKHQREYMSRALTLAKRGLGFTSPNPMVGAVLVKNEEIIGEGFHKQFGGAHAEVHAIADAESKGFSAKGAAMYVTLEPCAHQGKTPSCAELLIQKKIREVHIASLDPNPQAAGGKEKLKSAGIQVSTGILRKEAEKVNRFFFHFHRKKRPFFLGKSAISRNGYVAKAQGEKTQISGPQAQRFVHFLRQECDAILIGAETAITDNPELSVRFRKHCRDPLRILLDPKRRIPPSAKVFRDENYLHVTQETNSKLNKNSIQLKTDTAGVFDLHQLAETLFQKHILSILVEGGPKTLHSFLSSNLLDEFILIQSKNNLPDSGVPLFPHGFPKSFHLQAEQKIGTDTIYQQSFIH